MPRTLQIILSLLLSAGVAALAFLFVPVTGWWVQCMAAGAHVPILSLARARWRRLPVHDIVTARVLAHKSGLAISFDEFAAVSQRGGSPVRAATMLGAMAVAEFHADPERVLELEARGELADYMRKWQDAGSQGKPPPELPSAEGG